jgi:Holliday junction resolvase RusA-like endonuclease
VNVSPALTRAKLVDLDFVSWESRKRMITARFVIPGDPMPSARKRLDTRHNRLYTPTEEAERVKFVQLCARAARPQFVGAGPVHTALRFFLTHRPDAMKRADGDNLEKLIFDACNGICWKDDGQIVRGIWEKYQDKLNPRTEVIVAEYLR